MLARRRMWGWAAIWATLAINSATAAPVSVTWTTTGNAGNETSVTATVTGANVSAIPLTRGAGLGPNAGTNSFNSNGWTGEATDYVQFGISIDPGFQATLNTVSFSRQASSTGPGTMGLFSSLDNFTTAITTFSSGTSAASISIPLSSLGTVTGDVTLRLFAIGTTSASGGTTAAGGTFRVINPTLTGEVSVIPQAPAHETAPEPTTMWTLAVLGVFALVFRLRRRWVPCVA
ncbi:MAG: hypothetical protein RMJ56_18165 [Gemmataceae bacterium]|nr:hypothetical protein [Gemmata sp.]MDW8199522.1 hypothetical protein [Gemmataceae bacterium]